MSSQATESTRMIEFLAWVEVNMKKLLIGAAVVGVAVAGYFLYQSHRNEAESEASSALLKADKAGARPDKAAEPGAQAFLQIVTAYPGTSAAGRALLFGADALFRENKYSEAKSQFEVFLREYPENPLAATAAFGVAASLDAMNKTNEAQVAYEDVLSRFAGSTVAAQAKLGLARLYTATDKPAQALKIYDELLRPGAQSTWTAEAGRLREQLLTRHPELAKTNAPAAAMLSAGSNAPATNLPLLSDTNPAPAKPTKPQ
jgi:TolA-binding protein